MIFTAEICWPWDWIETTTIVYCKKKAHFLQFATQLACWRIMFGEQAFGFIFVYLWILFKYLSDAVILKYQYSNLTEVPPAPLTLYVHELNLRWNLITELGPRSLTNYTDLTRLSLADNPLSVIHNGSFDMLSHLEAIYLSSTEIKHLPFDFGPSTTTLVKIAIWAAIAVPEIIKYPYFTAFSNLNTITIGSNNLDIKNASIFPPSTGFINIRNMKIIIFPHLSRYTPHVRTVYIGNNQLLTIPQDDVQDLTLLKEFNAQINQITTFPNFSHCAALEILNMGENKIDDIPRGHIIGLASIQEIHLTNNLIIVMPDISYLSTLETFTIGFNQISQIPEEYIVGLPNMTVFDCQSNNITSLPNISRLFPKIQALYVQGNHLMSLPDLYDLTSLGFLFAADNPYVCNQSLCWLRMLSWMRPSMTMLQDHPTCQEPYLAAGTRVVRYHPAAMGCYIGMDIKTPIA